MPDDKLSDEAGRLQILRTALSSLPRHPMVLAGVREADDGALLQISDTHSLAIGSDFVRGSGFDLFKLGLMTYRDVGYYLVVANLSDIAAMGAQPICLTTIIRYNRLMADSDFASVFDGIREAAAAYGVDIVGGDIGSYDVDVFSATAIGLVETSRALRRSGAETGDLLCVTNTVGLPVSALVYFRSVRPAGHRLDEAAEATLLASWTRPTAQVRDGVVLSARGFAHACQDISDGLRATVEELSASGGRTFTLFADALPIHDLTRWIAMKAGFNPTHLAMSASVDFQLLFCIPRSVESECREALEQVGTRMATIGEVNDLGQNLLRLDTGDLLPLPGVPWRHQTDDVLQALRSELGG